MIYKFADFVVELKNVDSKVAERFKDYISLEKPQFSIEINQDDIDYEMQAVDYQSSQINAILAAYLRKFINLIINYNAFFLHSALIDVDNVGVAFTAPSGTGKTTHIRLWKKLLNDKVTIVNGDKPIVRFFDNEDFPIGYGTPWNGKEQYGNNKKVPIKHLCFIQRAQTNSCEKIAPNSMIESFFNQIYIPKNNAESVANALKLADKFLNNVTIWRIKCNMDIEAAEIAFNTLFNNKNGQ